MNLIVAVDRNWGIGCEGDLLFHIKEDLKYFKEKTLKGIVIMGRKTLESLPKGQPFKDRTNIVLTRCGLNELPQTVLTGERSLYLAEDISRLEEILNQLDHTQNDEDVWIVGGESIYTKFLPYCQYAYVTKIDSEKPADKFIPNLDSNPDWEPISKSDTKEENGTAFSFWVYENKRISEL